MSYRRLDAKNKPIPRKGRTTREPATRMVAGLECYHYEITFAVSAGGGKWRYVKRRFWLPDDAAAERKQRELKFEPPVDALTWRGAAAAYLDSKRVAATYRAGVESTIGRWCASLGADSTLEGTSLAVFCAWLESRRKGGTGRAAQLDYSHLMAIARWCKKRAMVRDLPFEDAPKPEARARKRKPAGVDQFHAMTEVLPEAMRYLWRMLGLTGMRLSAACTLLESRIGERTFTVTTKGGKEVTYTITPAIARLIREAREWKAEKGRATEYLFCNTHGAAWNNQSYGQQLRKVCDRLKIPRVTAHQLRHLAGTAMAQANLSADIIQAGLGHSSRKSAEVYIDQTQSMRDQALHAVDAILEKSDDKKVTKKDTKNDNSGKTRQSHPITKTPKKKQITCPHCGHKHLVSL